MPHEPANKSSPTGSDSRRSAAWAWGSVAMPFVLFFLGGIIFNEAASEKPAVSGRMAKGGGEAWVAIGLWLLAVCVSVFILRANDNFRLGVRSKTVMKILAVSGIVLNGLPLIVPILIKVVLQGPGWGR